MILVLSPGHFCPKDHQQHLELAAAYPKIAVAYTRIVTISTDNIVETREFRASVGAQWTFLSDAGRKVRRDLDIQEYTDPYHDPMVPHTIVLKPGLVIHSVYSGYWFWGRPSRCRSGSRRLTEPGSESVWRCGAGTRTRPRAGRRPPANTRRWTPSRPRSSRSSAASPRA